MYPVASRTSPHSAATRHSSDRSYAHGHTLKVQVVQAKHSLLIAPRRSSSSDLGSSNPDGVQTLQIIVSWLTGKPSSDTLLGNLDVAWMHSLRSFLRAIATFRLRVKFRTQSLLASGISVGFAGISGSVSIDSGFRLSTKVVRSICTKAASTL